MIVLGIVIGVVFGFGVAWFIYTKKLSAIKGEVTAAESWATGEARSLLDRVKAHL